MQPLELHERGHVVVFDKPEHYKLLVDALEKMVNPSEGQGTLQLRGLVQGTSGFNGHLMPLLTFSLGLNVEFPTGVRQALINHLNVKGADCLVGIEPEAQVALFNFAAKAVSVQPLARCDTHDTRT